MDFQRLIPIKVKFAPMMQDTLYSSTITMGSNGEHENQSDIKTTD